MATIKYWDGSAWQYAVVGKQGPVGATGPTGPAGSASLQRFRFVATGGETSLSGTDANGNTLAYTAGLEEVFINGAAQVRGQDYTATNGTSITGLTALVASDVVEILAWGVFNVSNTISNTLVDAKGDLLAGTGADSVGRLAVGSNGTVLTADSAEATGLKWAAVSGAENWSLLNSGGTALSGSSAVTISGISNAESILVVYVSAGSATANQEISFRLNGDTNSNYINITRVALVPGTTYNQDIARSNTNSSLTYIPLGWTANAANQVANGSVLIRGCNSAGIKPVLNIGGGQQNASAFQENYIGHAIYNSTSTISSITLRCSTNFNSGTVFVYTTA